MELNNLTQYESLDQEGKKVERALLNSAQAGLSLAEALQQANAAAKALASTSSRVKRVLAGFDQINRLGEAKKTGSKRSGSKKTNKTETPDPKEKEKLSGTASGSQPLPQIERVEIPGYNAFLDDILHITEFIQCIQALSQKLRELWQQVLVPFGSWVSTTLVPAFTQSLSRGIDTAVGSVTNLFDQAAALWQQLQIGAQSIAAGIVPAVRQLGQGIENLAAGFLESCNSISLDTLFMGNRVCDAAQQIRTALSDLRIGWQLDVAALKTVTAGVATGIVDSLKQVVTYLTGGFTQGWSDGFAGLKTPVKGVVNSIIGFFNSMISGMAGAINAVINAANKLKFTVPDWVPGIGGKQYGFSLKTVTAPKIPYLAQGAVLPANRPFLAMVGDQRHGTNVEAPLATIQEAVAAVMADHTAGNMAGHEATVAVLNQILEAVLGIEVGEAVVARAVQNHRLKNAVMKGGGF